MPFIKVESNTIPQHVQIVELLNENGTPLKNVYNNYFVERSQLSDLVKDETKN